MSKKKIITIVLLVLVVLGLCIFLLVQCQRKPDDDEPVNNNGEVIKTQESDIEIEDYEEYDWQNETGETVKKEDSFQQNQNNTSDKNEENTSENKDDGVGLRHNESKNEGIEVEFDSWDAD